TVLSYDADASRVESCEKATDLTLPRWPSSVFRQLPLLLVSQILSVLSSDADASPVESCEKASNMTLLRWPSSVCRHAFHSKPVFGNRESHCDASSFNISRRVLLCGEE